MKLNVFAEEVKPVPRLAATPDAMARSPLMVVAEVSVFVPEPVKVTLLKVVAEAASVWFPPPKLTVPVPGVKRDPVPFQAVAVVLFSLRVLELALSVPAVSVTSPENVWVKLEPKFKIPPPGPLTVNPPPVTFPVKVAVPVVFVMETSPEVEKLPIFCVAAVPVIVTAPVPLVKVPELIKSLLKVKPLAPVVRVEPLLMVSATPVLKTLLPPGETTPAVFAITTPPVAIVVASHSEPAV